MKALLVAVAACGTLLAVAALAEDKPAAAPAKQAATIMPADIKWGPVPPVLPPGAQIAVLHGDPFKKTYFALRLKLPDGYRVAPHWHTNDEQLTVLSGTFMLAMGDKEADAHALEAGAFHFLPGKMHHSALAKGETIVEVHGLGPFDIHYLNPADDPMKKVEAAK
jgi:hypothetical protein